MTVKNLLMCDLCDSEIGEEPAVELALGILTPAMAIEDARPWGETMHLHTECVRESVHHGALFRMPRVGKALLGASDEAVRLHKQQRAEEQCANAKTTAEK